MKRSGVLRTWPLFAPTVSSNPTCWPTLMLTRPRERGSRARSIRIATFT
jgi:hypothetical protein